MMQDLKAGVYEFRVLARSTVDHYLFGPISGSVTLPTDAECPVKEDSGVVQWKMGFEEDFSEIGVIAR